MIQTEIITINNKQFIHTWSNENRHIIRDGIEYNDAYDPAELNREYTEGDFIEEIESEANEILSIIMGENLW